MAENFGTCFYVLSRLVPAPVQRLYGQYFGENLDKVNPNRAKLTYVNIKWDASSPWSFYPNSTIGKTQPTLKKQ